MMMMMMMMLVMLMVMMRMMIMVTVTMRNVVLITPQPIRSKLHTRFSAHVSVAFWLLQS